MYKMQPSPPPKKTRFNSRKSKRTKYLAAPTSTTALPATATATSTPVKFDRPIKVGNKVIDSPDRRPSRSCLVRVHSAFFCCINFNGLCAWVNTLALSGSRNKGHAVYKNTTAEDRKLLDALNILPKSIERLYEVFVQIDRDGSGEISIGEFFRYFSHKRRFPQKSKFSKRVFQIMDADASGELSFVEFVVALWNYCTFTKASLLRFAFELFDADDSGFIDLDEMKLLLRECYGKHKYKKTQAARHILNELESMIEKGKNVGGLNLNDFNEFCLHHPALLYPAFELQQALQQNVLGSQFWQECQRRKLKHKKEIEKKNRLFDKHKHNHYEKEIAIQDMSYKELVSYLEGYGQHNQQEAEAGAETDNWWKFEGGDTNLPGKIRISKEEEAHAHSIEMRLNKSVTNSYHVQMPCVSSNKKRLGMGQITMSKMAARKWKMNRKNRSQSRNRTMSKFEKEGGSIQVPVQPWTCPYCDRLNTTSLICKTCQKPL